MILKAMTGAVLAFSVLVSSNAFASEHTSAVKRISCSASTDGVTSDIPYTGMSDNGGNKYRAQLGNKSVIITHSDQEIAGQVIDILSFEITTDILNSAPQASVSYKSTIFVTPDMKKLAAAIAGGTIPLANVSDSETIREVGVNCVL